MNISEKYPNTYNKMKDLFGYGDELLSKHMTPKSIIKLRYNISIHKMDVLHKRLEVQEPILVLCERIMTNPSRFNLVDTAYVKLITTGLPHLYEPSYELGCKAMIDKDTGQRIVCCIDDIEFPTFLTRNERRLLFRVVQGWYEEMMDKFEEERLKRKEKLKNKHRQEMIDLYKDYIK